MPRLHHRCADCMRFAARRGRWLLPVLLLAGSPAAAKPPRFFFQVRAVQVPPGSAPGLKDKARATLMAELKQQPTVVLELGDPPPQGADLEKTLEARKLLGYELVLRVRKSSHELKPPAPGKAYKQLMVEVDVAIDAQQIPGGQLALAGEGNSQVGTEVKAVREQEKQQLLGEALNDAVKQAVSKSVSKLGTSKTTKAPRRKKKK
jgi:hypothetical protein